MNEVDTEKRVGVRKGSGSNMIKYEKSMMYTYAIAIMVLLGGWQAQAKMPWSHIYKRLLTDKDHTKKKQSYVYKQDSRKMPFTQLIISWNAQRPTQGHFLFKVRVRDLNTKKWDIWHDVAIWGKEQKSFFSRGSLSVFNYSRLEMEGGREGDAFEIVVYPQNGASLSQLKGIFVAASHVDQFKQEAHLEAIKGLRSCSVQNLALKSQMEIDHPQANSLCSPTSVSIVVQMLVDAFIDPLTTAHGVYDAGLNIFGNWAFNMAHAFDLVGGKFLFYAMRPSSFREVYECLQKNIPVAVSIRGEIKGGKKPYNNGHLLVVTGWDAQNKKVICCDPAFDTADQVKREYEIAHFLSAWERSRRLTYMSEPLL